jgi:DNA recombination protein RmuC
VGFTEDMKKIGAQINGTQKTYDEAFGKLHSGRGSLTSSVENLKKLGAKASKQLDKNLVDEEDNFTAPE